jgi:large conductance mechanosensitive channel
MWKEFKEFALRGNVIDMAVGIIIGAAFGTIAKSLVDNIIMPPIGLLLGNVDFSNMFLVIKQGADAVSDYQTVAEANAAGAVTINYGMFINNIVSFLIVSIAIFLMVKSINTLKRKEEVAPAEPTTKDCPYCFSKIPLKATKCPQCTSEVKGT